MGPTASGKTDLAMLIAQHYPVEVISVDSALIYRDMNIGTAKPDADFLARLPHFLIDIRDPNELYSVADFRRDALATMQEITARGNVPLLVGGSMLYFKVLVEGIADVPQVPADVREQILREAEQKGWPAMHQELEQVDPVAARRIHPNHSQRIQRALEVYRALGKQLSAYHEDQGDTGFDYRPLQIALGCDRALLHQRIERRFRLMLDNGFVEEVEALKTKYVLEPDMPSMRSVGYRQVWQYLDGELDRDQLYEKGCVATRQLAKRQHTWLRKWQGLAWLSVNDVDFGQESGARARIIDEIHRLCADLSISPLT